MDREQVIELFRERRKAFHVAMAHRPTGDTTVYRYEDVREHAADFLEDIDSRHEVMTPGELVDAL